MSAWRRARGRARVAVGVALVAAVAGLAALAGSGGREAPGQAAPAPASPSTATAPAGWERVEPGGRTRCGRGGRFAFWARMGAPDRLLVFFQGGGGCWDRRTCAPGAGFFDDRVDAGDDPSLAGAGVLDLDDARNPFRGWSVLFVPSCTGDVYAGDATRTYRAGGAPAVTVHHRGHANASAALEWVFARVPDPRQVFVTGCSAGSVGSILHAPRVLRQYPRAQVTMPRLYRAVAGHWPRATFAQVNFREDAVQRRFHEAAGGAPAAFGQALAGSLAAIRAASPNFRSCLLDGSDHCALPRPEFYTLDSGGVRLRDWVAALAAGDPVANLPPGS